MSFRVRLTLAQKKHAEWALDAMGDMAGEPGWYGEDDLPLVEDHGARHELALVFPTTGAVDDILYRFEEQLPAMAHMDDPRAHTSSVASAQRLADKIRSAATTVGWQAKEA